MLTLLFTYSSGILNNWKWPAIPGLHNYQGTLLHTANWDENIDLTGKHVGLIGNGSSGIQVLPTIQPHVSHVTTFVREPTWVSPVQGLEQHVFTPQERADFERKPGALTAYRKNIESGLNGQFSLFLKNTATNNSTHDYMVQQMKEKIGDDNLAAKLIPEWAVGCRRLTPGVGYLESLTKPNVTTIYGEIERITERGCVCDDGNEYPIDVLICATGFDTTFKPRFPLIAPNGKNLQEEWAKEPASYLGIAAAEFPNYLIFLGPNCPIGNGPVSPNSKPQTPSTSLTFPARSSPPSNSKQTTCADSSTTTKPTTSKLSRPKRLLWTTSSRTKKNL